MAATPDPNKMVFTNRNEDAKGYGVLSITNNDPNDFQATIDYTPLSLGSPFDDFDVNEAVEVVVVPYEDTHYAFVAGHNYRALGLGLPGWNGKGNIGIIKDALSDNPQLVAGTQPLPEAQVNGVALSGDGKALYAAYPGLESTFVFDVEQMLATASNPSHWGDLKLKPIEELNPNIFLAGRLKTTEDPMTGEQRYEVAPDDPLAPISTEGEDYSVTVASTVDVVSLNSPPSDDLTPTLSWDFEAIDEDDISEINVFVSTFEEGEGLFPWDEVVDISDNSVLPNLSSSEKRDLLTRDWNGYDDFNPGRILTATWRDGQWYGYDDQTLLETPEDAPPNTATQLTLPDDRQLTAGQTYHWAVQALDKTGKILDEDVEQLSVHPPETTSPFSSVTVLTHGFRLPTAPEGIPDNIYNLAGNIASAGGDGLIMRYNSDTGEWDAINESGAPRPNVEPSRYLGQPLVLLPDWSEGSQSYIPDSGFSEAAADAFFAALVDLDRSLGGDAELDVATGEYVTQHGKVFDSPLHFIGFSRGTVVNSEMIQRLGKYFPEAGGAMGSGVRDLQMTTIDPHDFEQPSLSLGRLGVGLGFATFYEPEIQVWENVTFADNYYQTVPQLNEPTATPAGRVIPDADLNVFLGGTVQPEVSGNVRREDSRAGFTRETDALLGSGLGAVHGRTVSWYDGTVDLSETEAPDALYRRLGDSFHEHLFDPNLANNSEFESGLANPWYVPDHTAANFALEDESAPHEGIGTGWFYSVLGGGNDLRPEARLDRRQPVTFDNTNGRENRGDFAVPTVFNGNFDITTNPNSFTASVLNSTEAIPGWSFHNGDTFTSFTSSSPLASRLVDLKDVAGLVDHLEKSGNKPNSPKYQTDFALNLKDGDSIVHNRIFIPYEGQFGFDIFVPNLVDPGNVSATGDAIKIYLDDRELKSFDPTFEKINFPLPKSEESNNYIENPELFANMDRPAVDLRPPVIPDSLTMQGQQNRVEYGKNGLERFYVDIPKELRGKTAPLKVEVSWSRDGEILLDNLGFGSEHLKFGVPALNGVKPVSVATSSGYSENNLLLEKPQYSLSYNHQQKIPNWVSWHLDNTWLGFSDRPEGFARDITLPFPFLSKVKAKDYPPGNNALFGRGHLAAFADRQRAAKDVYGTFTMSNIVPQAQDKENYIWTQFEKHLRDKHAKQGHSVHIIAGGGGKLPDFLVEEKLLENEIHVPYYLWKVALILKNPKLDLQDLSEMSEENLDQDVKVISIKIPNEPITNLSKAQRKWEYWTKNSAQTYWETVNAQLNGFEGAQTSTITSVETLQDELKLELFPNLPQNVKDWIEEKNL